MYTVGVVLATLACVAPLMWLYRNSLVNTAAEIIVDCDGRLRQANRFIDEVREHSHRLSEQLEKESESLCRMADNVLRHKESVIALQKENHTLRSRNELLEEHLTHLRSLLGVPSLWADVSFIDNIDLTAPQSNATVPVLGPESGVISISHQTP